MYRKHENMNIYTPKLIYSAMDKLTIFTNRLEMIGIKVELVGNLPWVYIDSINGKKVTEIYQGNHGFTIAYLTVKDGILFTDLHEIFKLIRKYADIKKANTARNSENVL